MFARTRRLTLRPGWPEDADAVTAAIAHESVVNRLAHVPWPYERHHAEAWLSREDASAHVMLIDAHDLGDRPVLVGAIGLHPDDVVPDSVQIGYWLTPTAWGRGYATEAAGHLVGIARDALGHRELYAYHHLDNPASGRVLRKVGFRETGPTRRASLARGGEVDGIAFHLAFDRTSPTPLVA